MKAMSVVGMIFSIMLVACSGGGSGSPAPGGGSGGSPGNGGGGNTPGGESPVAPPADNHKVPSTKFLTNQDMEHVINMLTNTSQSSMAYKGTENALKGKTVPSSFFNDANYWANYVCSIYAPALGQNCHVKDRYFTSQMDIGGITYQAWWLVPFPLIKTNVAGNMQIERVMVNYGTNIYDGATWQIALAIAKSHNYSLHGVDPDNENDFVIKGYTQESGSNFVMRGNVKHLTYNVIHNITGDEINPDHAYSFRMLTRKWLSADSFTVANGFLTTYVSLDPASAPLAGNYKLGLMSWQDYKPITGENAWAMFIGPLQAAYLDNNGNVSTSDPAVQNAINILTTVGLLQSTTVGGVAYAPAGSLGNEGDLVIPNTISTENNISLLAGLLMLENILEKNGDTHSQAYKNVYSMIHGGSVSVGGFKDGSTYSYTTPGILYFMKTYAYNKTSGIFEQGGVFDDSPSAMHHYVQSKQPKTVDVNTWAIATLGAPLIDSWFGAGTSYRIWQEVKRFGGYYGPDGTLWGVGYSGDDGNGCPTLTNCKFTQDGINSGEWTLGAMDAVQFLIAAYGQDEKNYPGLKQDLDSMVKGLQTLRSDRFATYSGSSTGYPKSPTNYNSLVNIPSDELGYMYASKRYFIPFGWFANPLPSMASTAWAVMLNYGFAPFTLGGGDGKYPANFAPNTPVNVGGYGK